MEVAGYKMPDQNLATDLLEKILSRKCKIHREFSCEYVHLKPSECSPRLCFQCMEERNIPLSEAISVRLLLQATQNTTFNSYPKYSDSSIPQKIYNLKGSEDRISTDLSSFFNSLQSAVSQAIEKAKNTSKQKLTSLLNSYQVIFNSLSQISKIEQFQQIVKNDNHNEEKLREFIQVQYSSMNNYTAMINNKVMEYQMIQKSFSLTDANNKLREIVKIIEGITLFSSIENNQLLQPLQQQQNLFQQRALKQKLPIFLPSQQQHHQEQKQQQIPQQQLRESQHQKLQNQSSSSKTVYDYYRSLYNQYQEKHKDDIIIREDRYNYDREDREDREDYILYLLKRYNYDREDREDSYEQWQGLSEETRQDTLRCLKRELNITD